MLGLRGIPATWGGVERHVEELTVRFAQMGHDVTVYCRSYYCKDYKEDTYKGVKLKRLPAINTTSLDAVSQTILATAHIIPKDYDIVHYHSAGKAMFTVFPRIFGKRCVSTIHGAEWQRDKWGAGARTVLRAAEWAAVRFPHAAISVSKCLKSYLEEKYHRRIRYIPSAVNDPVFRPPDKIREFGLSQKDYILFVARLVPEKGLHFLIDAYNRLDTNKKLVIAGDSHHSDQYVDELKQRANKNVLFVGYQYGEALQELYTNAYCYVQPSTIEGLSVTLLEAVVYGNCIITSDIPPNLEVVNDNAMIFENKNVDGLEEALKKVISNPGLAQQLGLKAQAMGAAEYNYDSIAAKTIQLYEWVLQDKWSSSLSVPEPDELIEAPSPYGLSLDLHKQEGTSVSRE
ncbi:MAG: glycosyltransferase family 4 protein [Armatimonadota bacterium]|nr:glycosyltransferase family 4 protein [Armatimonadota bacterium]